MITHLAMIESGKATLANNVDGMDRVNKGNNTNRKEEEEEEIRENGNEAVEGDTEEGENEEREEESQWVVFNNPEPLVVQARFNITQIEYTPSTEERKEKEEDPFLQMLIEEGIPVKESIEGQEEPSNVGVILPPTGHNTGETPISLISECSGIEASSIVNNVENIVEITGLNNTISVPLFLHLIPTSASLHDEMMASSTEHVDDVRRGSINPSIILSETSTPLPVKKRVRFDLPGRKASLIGEYEILRSPVNTHNNMSPRPRKQKPRSRNNSSRTSLDVEDDHSSNGDAAPTSRRKHRKKRRRQYNVDNISNDDQEEEEEEEEEEEDSDKSNHRFIIDEDIDENDESSGFEADSSEDERSRDDGLDTRCGIKTCTPNWIQMFARNEFYLLVFCLIALLHGMLYTYNIAVMSTIQKRFRLTSRQTGFILTGNDISQILISIFVAFYGTYAHRPKWMGYGALCSSAAALLAASPHFIYGSGDLAAGASDPLASVSPPSWEASFSRKFEVCGDSIPETCPGPEQVDVDDSYYTPVVLLFCSQLLVGIATSIFWSVGISYLDDNVDKRHTSIYIAMFTIMRVVGPTLGFMLGGYCLSFWINPNMEVDFPQIKNWIGAWWLGFVILATCISVPGMLYFFFPREMPLKTKRNIYKKSPFQFLNGGGKKEILELKSSRPYESSVHKYQYERPSFIELPMAIKRLVTNKIWAANVFSNVTFVLAMSGYWNFKPKYIQSQFRKDASSATFYTGTTTMVASVIGICISGVVLRFGRPKSSYITGYNVFLVVYAIVSLMALMSIHCTPPEIAGHLPGQEKWACSSHCTCSEAFIPICAEDGVTTFYSPCFAGCSDMKIYVNSIEYSNCTCFGRIRWEDAGNINNNNININNININNKEDYPDNVSAFTTLGDGWAIDGFCPDSCNALTYYLAVQIVTKVAFATGRISGILINLRSVDERDRTLSLGCLSFFIAFVGFIPASLLMGSAIDSTCLVWDTKCGEKGECSLYDNNKFRLVMHAIPAAVLVLSGIGDLIVYLNHAALDFYGDQGKKENSSKDEESSKLRKRVGKR